jgi:peptidoglycan L-alanyl-D-glutamate endopeptidase CwlK
MKPDKVTLDKIDLLHPLLREEAKQIISELDERLNGRVRVRFTHTLRTFAEQDALYAQGRTTAGKIVTFAKGGDSWHNYGMAIDICLLLDKDNNGTYETASWDFFKDEDKDGQIDFEEIDFVFKKYGWVGLYRANGQRWDFPHFQKTLGFTMSEVKKMHAEKKFITGTTYLAINNNSFNSCV